MTILLGAAVGIALVALYSIARSLEKIAELLEEKNNNRD